MSGNKLSPYMLLVEMVEHVGWKSAAAAEQFSGDHIELGDRFRINNPAEPLHGHKFICEGVRLNVKAETGDEVPRLLEFLVKRKDFPDLVRQPDVTGRREGNDKDIDAVKIYPTIPTYAEMFGEDARRCERIGPCDEGNRQVRRDAFAIQQLLFAASNIDDPLPISGRQKGFSELEVPPSSYWVGAGFNLVKFYSVPAKPSAPDAIVYEDLQSPRREIRRRWPLLHKLDQLQGADKYYAILEIARQVWEENDGRMSYSKTSIAVCRRLPAPYGAGASTIEQTIRRAKDSPSDKRGIPDLETFIRDYHEKYRELVPAQLRAKDSVARQEPHKP